MDQKIFVAMPQKTLDLGVSIPIIETMMHRNIAPEEMGRARKNF
jgi:hypothetical protein